MLIGLLQSFPRGSGAGLLQFLHHRIWIANNFAISTPSSSEQLPQSLSSCNVPQSTPFPVQMLTYAVEKEINERLDKGKFDEARDIWKNFLRTSQSSHGVHQLIDYALKNSRERVLRKNIKSLWELSKANLQATDFLAYLVVSMLENGHFEDAEIFAKKFAIHGTSFIKPLDIAAEKNDLNFIEQFGTLLENVYYKIPKRQPKKKAANREASPANNGQNEYKQIIDEGNSEILPDEKQQLINQAKDVVMIGQQSADQEVKIIEMKEQQKQQTALATDEDQEKKGFPEESEKFLRGKFNTLIWIWIPVPSITSKEKQKQSQKPKKWKKFRLHKTDQQKLDKLTTHFLQIWANKPAVIWDQNSHERFRTFIQRNNLEYPQSDRADWVGLNHRSLNSAEHGTIQNNVL